MGVHPLIRYDRFPEQSPLKGQPIELEFADGSKARGIIVRYDVNFPWLNRRIVQLDDDRYILIQTTNDPAVAAQIERGPLDETKSPVFAAGGYPPQGSWHMKRTEVCFWYDTEHIVMGTIVRDDQGAPGETIIALDDGRWVLTGECMHSPQ